MEKEGVGGHRDGDGPDDHAEGAELAEGHDGDGQEPDDEGDPAEAAGAEPPPHPGREIGRASCRERV